jgi:hypothetical protein
MPQYASAEPLRSPTDLDGVYLALGPVGALVRSDGAWDGAFGGEASIWRVREHEILSAAGLGFGGQKFAEGNGGRLWADVLAAHRTAFGVAIGLGAGVTAQIDEVVPPKWGGHGTLWVYAGIVPYVRVGGVEGRGVFVDVGLKVVLPALRW